MRLFAVRNIDTLSPPSRVASLKCQPKLDRFTRCGLHSHVLFACSVRGGRWSIPHVMCGLFALSCAGSFCRLDHFVSCRIIYVGRTRRDGKPAPPACPDLTCCKFQVRGSSVRVTVGGFSCGMRAQQSCLAWRAVLTRPSQPRLQAAVSTSLFVLGCKRW